MKYLLKCVRITKLGTSDLVTIATFLLSVGGLWYSIQSNNKDVRNLIKTHQEETSRQIEAICNANQKQINELWKLHGGNIKTEQKSMVGILQMELAEQHAAISSNLKIIDQNLQALQSGQMVVIPLHVLPVSAWESAKLRNDIFIDTTADFFKMVNLYSAIHIVNEKITFRENYRQANQAISNYSVVLKTIDIELRNSLENLSELHSVAQNFLHKKYPLVVKGDSFSLENGLVKDESLPIQRR